MRNPWMPEPDSGMTRRDPALKAGKRRERMTKQPNILFVMADQMAPGFLPIHGHPLVKTPNLERLASRGVVFESAYCASPLCAPSRFSMMAGRLPSGIGPRANAAAFAADVPTSA